MRPAFRTHVDQCGGEIGLMLDLSRFANHAFGAGPAPNPTEFMAVLGQAIQLLRPDVVWVDLLHLAQLAIGKEELDAAGPAALRAFLEDAAHVAVISRNFVSVCSATRPPTPIVLDLGSPADWMRFYNEPPECEIDDLDAEDILVFLVNALQRMDLEDIGALSIDATHPITGDFGETCAPIRNFCAHQGLDLLVASAAGPDSPGTGAKQHRLHTLPEDDGHEFTAWRLAFETPPDQALACTKTITNQQET